MSKLVYYPNTEVKYKPKGETEFTTKFLTKPKNKAIATVLKKGLSLRQTASEVGVSINTVRKVKAALENGVD